MLKANKIQNLKTCSINRKTKAISVVHLGGWPADVIEIKKLEATFLIK